MNVYTWINTLTCFTHCVLFAAVIRGVTARQVKVIIMSFSYFRYTLPSFSHNFSTLKHLSHFRPERKFLWIYTKAWTHKYTPTRLFFSSLAPLSLFISCFSPAALSRTSSLCFNYLNCIFFWVKLKWGQFFLQNTWYTFLIIPTF